jgi:hypothetical protein
MSASGAACRSLSSRQRPQRALIDQRLKMPREPRGERSVAGKLRRSRCSYQPQPHSGLGMRRPPCIVHTIAFSCRMSPEVSRSRDRGSERTPDYVYRGSSSSRTGQQAAGPDRRPLSRRTACARCEQHRNPRAAYLILPVRQGLKPPGPRHPGVPDGRKQQREPWSRIVVMPRTAKSALARA